MIVLSFESSSSSRISYTSSVSGAHGGQRRTRAHLESHRDFSRLVPDLLHRPVVALAELLVQLKVVHLDLEGSTRREVDSIGVDDCFGGKVESTRRVSAVLTLSVCLERRGK